MRWHAPLDPDCEDVRQFEREMDEDPMNDHIPGDVLSDIREDFARKHRAKCRRCQEFGCANIEVIT